MAACIIIQEPGIRGSASSIGGKGRRWVVLRVRKLLSELLHRRLRFGGPCLGFGDPPVALRERDAGGFETP